MKEQLVKALERSKDNVVEPWSRETSEELLLAMVGRGDLGRVDGKLEEMGKLGNIFSPLFLSPTFTGIRNNGGGS